MRKFGVRDQISYMFGDVGGSFVNIYVDAYFMMFCTYVLHLSPYFMGTLFLLARLWDALSAPLIGSIPDRRRLGASGDKFKPYIRAAMLPLALSGVLCFLNVSGWGNAAKQVWVSVCYVLYGMAYTFASMPYGSLASVVTGDPGERTKLSRARSIGGMLVNFGALSLVPLIVFDPDGEIHGGRFEWIAIIFGICSLLCYAILLRGTIERVQLPAPQRRFRFGRVLRGVLHNRPLIGAMLATMGSLIAVTGQSQFGSYLYKEYYHAPRMLSAVNLATLPVTALLFPLVPRLCARWGKRRVILAACFVSLGFSALLFAVPIPNVWLFFALNLLATLGNNVFSMLVWALVIDCIDYQEAATGERSDGSVYSIFTFARKLGATFASAIASYGLGWMGFESGAAVQSPAVAGNIRALCTSIPLLTTVLLLLGIGCIYNLSKEDTDRLSRELAERHR